jgi:ubiquinone/menaquinone biosynthesis C-methylase UbiE
MRENPLLTVEAIDSSGEMLKLLKDRVEGLGAAGRLTLRCEDARNLTLSGQYDLVATHFFLDCLSTEEIAALASRIRPYLAPNVVWVVSDFAIPNGAAALPSRIVVSSLYAAFGILTGLKTRSLPQYGEALRSAGFVLAGRKEWLGGLLFSELWTFEATDQVRILSH